MEDKKSGKTSSFYFKVSIFTLFVGFIFGLIAGGSIPSSISDDFNVPLMLTIWVGTVLAFLWFWAICAHLKNQEDILEELKKLNPNSPETPGPATEEQTEQQTVPTTETQDEQPTEEQNKTVEETLTAPKAE